jgi:hypothetical protein
MCRTGTPSGSNCSCTLDSGGLARQRLQFVGQQKTFRSSTGGCSLAKSTINRGRLKHFPRRVVVKEAFVVTRTQLHKGVLSSCAAGLSDPA